MVEGNDNHTNEPDSDTGTPPFAGTSMAMPRAWPSLRVEAVPEELGSEPADAMRDAEPVVAASDAVDATPADDTPAADATDDAAPAETDDADEGVGNQDFRMARANEVLAIVH